MLFHSEVLVKSVVLRTDSKRFSYLLYFCVSVYREVAFVWFRHSRKHGDSCGLSGAVMSQQSENLPLVHTHCQVIDCDYGFIFAPSELFAQSHDFNSLVVLLLIQQSLLYFFIDISVTLLSK